MNWICDDGVIAVGMTWITVSLIKNFMSEEVHEVFNIEIGRNMWLHTHGSFGSDTGRKL